MTELLRRHVPDVMDEAVYQAGEGLILPAEDWYEVERRGGVRHVRAASPLSNLECTASKLHASTAKRIDRRQCVGTVEFVSGWLADCLWALGGSGKRQLIMC